MSRTSTFTVTCDRCWAYEQLPSFHKRELQKLADGGWWSYTSARLGQYMPWQASKDFCPSCAATVQMIAKDALRDWVPYENPAHFTQYKLRDQAESLTKWMEDDWLVSLRDGLTQELRRRRKQK